MEGVGRMGNEVEGVDEEETTDWDCVGMNNDSCWYWMMDFLDFY